MLGSRRTGHLYPSTCNALLSDVVPCSTVCWFGFFFFNSQAKCAVMDLVVTLLPATPSQLSSSIPAMGGWKGCSLPALHSETVSLSQTLRLNSGQGAERASPSVPIKFTATRFAAGGSSLHTQDTLPCHH